MGALLELVVMDDDRLWAVTHPSADQPHAPRQICVVDIHEEVWTQTAEIHERVPPHQETRPRHSCRVSGRSVLARASISTRPRDASDVDRVLPGIDTTVGKEHLRSDYGDIRVVRSLPQPLQTVFR